MVTLEELEERVKKLEYLFKQLKEYSDKNDWELREMIDTLTETVNHLHGITDEEVGGAYGHL